MADNTAKLHVTDTGGTGRPVVLIHGWPLSGESWVEQLRPLHDAGFRVITYDRRGFGKSDKPSVGYNYDTFADDLHSVLTTLELNDVSLVGFSMGGGEVARYASRHGVERLHSVVFASAVPPFLMKSEDNPEGPIDNQTFQGMRSSLESGREEFFKEFATGFFSVNNELQVSEEQRQEAVAMAEQSDQTAALLSMDAWATTDFREDLKTVTVPALIVHGDQDTTVPFDGSGKRTHQAIAGSELAVIADAPHGVNLSHAEEFNTVLLEFLKQ